MSLGEIIGTLAVCITTAILAWPQIRNTVPRRRSTLRADLEILKLLEPTDKSYQIVKANVDFSIRSIYGSRERQLQVYDWSLLILGIVFLSGFGWWTSCLISKGSWWAIATGFSALLGLIWVSASFQKPAVSKPSEETEESQEKKKPPNGNSA